MSAGPKGAAYLVGRSAATARLFEEIVAVAPSIDSVLIRAESGAGKEVVAKELHAQSSRKRKSFVVVNCASLNEPTGDAELYGYKKGAFTGADRDTLGLFQRADGGTLFLDELGELALPTQTKLLRALQGGKVRPIMGDEVTVNVRVLAATNLDLEDMVAKGKFRVELLSRFAERVEIRPLRERTDDIPDLVAFFIKVLRGQEGRNPKAESISSEALAKLQRHDWATNNVRELESAVKRALNRSRESEPEVLGAELFELRPSCASVGDARACAAAALLEVGHAIINEILSKTRAPASLKELSDGDPELDLSVQIARAFEARSFENKTKAAQDLFGFANSDTIRSVIRRAEKARGLSLG